MRLRSLPVRAQTPTPASMRSLIRRGARPNGRRSSVARSGDPARPWLRHDRAPVAHSAGPAHPSGPRRPRLELRSRLRASARRLRLQLDRAAFAGRLQQRHDRGHVAAALGEGDARLRGPCGRSRRGPRSPAGSGPPRHRDLLGLARRGSGGSAGRPPASTGCRTRIVPSVPAISISVRNGDRKPASSCARTPPGNTSWPANVSSIPVGPSCLRARHLERLVPRARSAMKLSG